MNEFYKVAADKLEAGAKGAKGRKEAAVCGAVKAALLDFCSQDAEFAQAVAQGGSFPDCLAAVCKGVGGSISDLDAYRRAVQFYFRGADVSFRMEIDLNPKPEDAAASSHDAPKILSLADFF